MKTETYQAEDRLHRIRAATTVVPLDEAQILRNMQRKMELMEQAFLREMKMQYVKASKLVEDDLVYENNGDGITKLIGKVYLPIVRSDDLSKTTVHLKFDDRNFEEREYASRMPVLVMRKM